MKQSAKSMLLSFLIATFAIGPFVSASSSSSLSALPPLPPPPNMVNGYRVVSSAPKPAIPPAAISQSGQNLPDGYGVIVGRVIDESTGAAVPNALVKIPELKLSTKSDIKGSFAFNSILANTNADSVFVTLVAIAPGFGKHTMTDIAIAPKAVATVTLALTRGSAPTHWYGIIRHPARHLIDQSQNVSAPSPVFSILPPDTFTSQTTPPTYIRVAMYALNTDGSKTGSLLRIDTVDFDFYVKHVLASEWTPLTWSATTTEQLKAGAMAVKEYGWYHVLFPKPTGQTAYDCNNSIDCQVYNPYLSYNVTDAAVDFTSGTGWYQGQPGKIFESSYVAGTKGDPSGCGTNCMTQYGSKYWADHGQSYTWILANYYTASTISYFTIPPKWPTNTFELNGTSNSVSLEYSSPSSTWYEVAQFVNGSWNYIYETQNTVTTIWGLQPSAQYVYSVAAYGPGGWSGGSFNGGWVNAVATSAPQFIQSPITNVFAATTSTIKMSATSTYTHIDEYKVLNWTGSLWKVAWDGMPQTVTSSVTQNYDPNPLPDVYIDLTTTPTRGFVYTATSLPASASSSYSIAFHDSVQGWSNYSNEVGSLTAFTLASQ